MEMQFMTFEKVMEYLGVTRGSLYNYCYRRLIKYYKPTGRRIYFNKADVDAFLAQNPVATAAEIEEEARKIVKKTNKK